MKYPFLIPFTLMLACGGSPSNTDTADQLLGNQERAERISSEDLAPRPTVARADLTTAVDEKRYRAAAPPAKEFHPKKTKVIYLVGRLKNVPTDSTIEVHWFLDSESRPMLISHIQGSENYQFIASFSPTDRVFIQGSYSARIIINETDIGGVPFTIQDEKGLRAEPEIQGLKISQAVSRKMKAKGTGTQFKEGTDKLFVSFKIRGIDPSTPCEIHWYRGDKPFHYEEIILAGERRYAAHIVSPTGLPTGKYRVEIEILHERVASQSFTVGSASEGPAIDVIAFGLTLNADNMPEKSMTSFKRNTSVIQCGIRFLDLPPDSVIEIQWTMIEEDGETVIYTNRSQLVSGGSGTMGAAWEPTRELNPGTYKAVVVLSGEKIGEETFEIE
jgi:hypothetical protein